MNIIIVIYTTEEKFFKIWCLKLTHLYEEFITQERFCRILRKSQMRTVLSA